MTRAEAYGCHPGFHKWQRFKIPRYLHLPPHLGGQKLVEFEVLDKCQTCRLEDRRVKPA